MLSNEENITLPFITSAFSLNSIQMSGTSTNKTKMPHADRISRNMHMKSGQAINARQCCGCRFFLSQARQPHTRRHNPAETENETSRTRTMQMHTDATFSLTVTLATKRDMNLTPVFLAGLGFPRYLARHSHPWIPAASAVDPVKPDRLGDSATQSAVGSDLESPHGLSVPSASERKFGVESVVLQHEHAHLVLNVEDLQHYSVFSPCPWTLAMNSVRLGASPFVVCMGLGIGAPNSCVCHRTLIRDIFNLEFNSKSSGKVWVLESTHVASASRA